MPGADLWFVNWRKARKQALPTVHLVRPGFALPHAIALSALPLADEKKGAIYPSTAMTQEDFDNLIKEIREEDPEQLSSDYLVREDPLKEEKVAKFEQKAGFRFPEEYRYFLRKYGAGEIGTVTVLSPDPDSQFSMWDGREEFDRESGFPFAEDSDGNFYAFLVENGACSKDVWVAGHGTGGDLSYTDYEDFFEFIAEVGFGVDS